MKKIVFLILLILCISVASPARAMIVDLYPDTGWQEFVHDANGSAWRISPSDPVAFFVEITKSCFLTVTDVFLPGDQYEVYSGGVSLGLTSTPIVDDVLWTSDYDFAALDARWSTGVFALLPGDYLISGTAFTPYTVGAGALRLDYLQDGDEPVVPEPATLLTLGFGLLGGFGFKRKRA